MVFCVFKMCCGSSNEKYPLISSKGPVAWKSFSHFILSYPKNILGVPSKKKERTPAKFHQLNVKSKFLSFRKRSNNRKSSHAPVPYMCSVHIPHRILGTLRSMYTRKEPFVFCLFQNLHLLYIWVRPDTELSMFYNSPWYLNFSIILS